MAADWAALPPELLRTIAESLTSDAADYIRFRAVCTTWRSSSLQTPPNLPLQLPWLLLPPPRPSPTSLRRCHRFFSLAANKFLSFELLISPSLHRIGSSHGWLAYLDTTTCSLCLLNPLTRSRLPLPSLSSFPDVVSFNLYSIGREFTLGNRHVSLDEMCNSFIKKIVLSSNPAFDQDYIVLCVIGLTGKIALCKNGDRAWVYIEEAQSYCEDVICHNNLFYAVNSFGNIAVCDVRGPTPRVSIIDIISQELGDLQYLARSSNGGLLLIGRYMIFDYFDNRYKTTKFEVFRLDLNVPKWEHVSYLGDDVLFLGENSTLALSSRDFCGFRGNCVYFTDDRSENEYGNLCCDHDSGIYDLGNGRIEPLPCCSHDMLYPRLWPPPVWVTPYPFL